MRYRSSRTGWHETFQDCSTSCVWRVDFQWRRACPWEVRDDWTIGSRTKREKSKRWTLFVILIVKWSEEDVYWLLSVVSGVFLYIEVLTTTLFLWIKFNNWLEYWLGNYLLHSSINIIDVKKNYPKKNLSKKDPFRPPVVTIFRILARCLSVTDLNNYMKH